MSRQMITTIAMGALISGAAMTTVAKTRSVDSSIMVSTGANRVHSEPRQAVTPLYAADRIEAGFAAVFELTPVRTSWSPVALKGDLPPGCVAFRPEIEAECIDAAYEPGSDLRMIVETRIGATSILERTVGDVGAGLVGKTARDWAFCAP